MFIFFKTCNICNIFIVNIYNFILVKIKNMLRTFWASKGLLNKKFEPQTQTQKFQIRRLRPSWKVFRQMADRVLFPPSLQHVLRHHHLDCGKWKGTEERLNFNSRLLIIKVSRIHFCQIDHFLSIVLGRFERIRQEARYERWWSVQV